ncbi:hypothetical protein [Roseivivax sp. CAU 1761]
MDAMQVSEYAHALYRAHGPRAEAEAAQKARECEERGKTHDAQNWREIRARIHQMRGPRQT